MSAPADSSQPLTIKQVNKLILFTILITIAFLFTRSSLRFFEDTWQERQPAYNVKWEHFASVFIGSARLRLQKEGFDADGILPSLLEYLHESFYESALGKIPESDGERAHFVRLYLQPALMTNSADVIRKNLSLLRDAYFSAAQKPIRCGYCRDVERFDDVSFLLPTLLGERAALGSGDRKAVIDAALKLVADLDTTRILHNPKPYAKAAALQFQVVLHMALSHEVFVVGNMECNNEYLPALLAVRRALLEATPRYASLKGSAHRVYEQAIAMLETPTKVFPGKTNCHPELVDSLQLRGEPS